MRSEVNVMNVLVVDDEPMMRKMVKLTLQRRGFQVADAANATDALALATKQPFDIVVTDVLLGEIDGWTLAESLTKHQSNVPLLFISGYPVDFERERQRYDTCAFLQKPFRPGELMDAISSLGLVTD